jgi:phosphonate metabolism transcriptional regulator PhnF
LSKEEKCSIVTDLCAPCGQESGLEELARRPYDERSARAIWLQIYDRLGQAIEAGQVAPGSKLPGEVQLASMFRVNRVTMRRALALHQSEGKLQARKGVGIFVRHRPHTFIIRDDMSFAESLVGSSEDITSRTLYLGRARPSPEAARLFGLTDGDEVIVLHRTRLVNNDPIYFTRKELPAHRFPDFEEIYATSGSVSAVYRAAGIAWFRRAQTRIRGGLAQGDEADILCISTKTPVQHVTAVNHDPHGNPIELSRGCWSMASVEFVFDASDK